MFAIFGLGNPDSKYSNNRHNVGFMAVDKIANLGNFEPWSSGHSSLNCLGSVGKGSKLFLSKPQTFMNRSGLAVQKITHFYKIPPSHVIVVHDELDLPFGEVRAKNGGGLAGHNGLKSIKECMGSADFIRIRIGIGRPDDFKPVADYVLSDFTKQQHEIMDSILEDIFENLPLLLDNKVNDFNQKLKEKNKGRI